MARGKQKGVVSLKDTVKDSDIVREGEVRNKPNYPFPDGNYGITGKYSDYSLVVKRIAYRTGTSEDGKNEGKVIEYETWEDYPCYSATLEGIFESYAKILNLTEFKTKKMHGDIKELIDIHNKTYSEIHKALSGIDTYINDKENEVCNLTDMTIHLKEQITEAKPVLTEYHKLIKDADKAFKEAKQIIVDNMPKEKKHRIKLEEN